MLPDKAPARVFTWHAGGSRGKFLQFIPLEDMRSVIYGLKNSGQCVQDGCHGYRRCENHGNQVLVSLLLSFPSGERGMRNTRRNSVSAEEVIDSSRVFSEQLA